MRILNPPRKLEKQIQHAMSEVESICLKSMCENVYVFFVWISWMHTFDVLV